MSVKKIVKKAHLKKLYKDGGCREFKVRLDNVDIGKLNAGSEKGLYKLDTGPSHPAPSHSAPSPTVQSPKGPSPTVQNPESPSPTGPSPAVNGRSVRIRKPKLFTDFETTPTSRVKAKENGIVVQKQTPAKTLNVTTPKPAPAKTDNVLKDRNSPIRKMLKRNGVEVTPTKTPKSEISTKPTKEAPKRLQRLSEKKIIEALSKDEAKVEVQKPGKVAVAANKEPESKKRKVGRQVVLEIKKVQSDKVEITRRTGRLVNRDDKAKQGNVTRSKDSGKQFRKPVMVIAVSPKKKEWNNKIIDLRDTQKTVKKEEITEETSEIGQTCKKEQNFNEQTDSKNDDTVEMAIEKLLNGFDEPMDLSSDLEELSSEIDPAKFPSNLWRTEQKYSERNTIRILSEVVIKRFTDDTNSAHDRLVSIKNNLNFYVKIENDIVSLLGAPPYIDTIEDLYVLLQIVDETTLDSFNIDKTI